MELNIRPLKSPEDGRFLEEIAIAAWGSDALDAIPGHLSLTVAKENGGVILLAFDGERPIGFCWGFWAYIEDEKRWKCASHQAGVLPEYKGKGIGERIKWAQREFVLGRGFNHMTWTFDPLETMNGSLNIRKLGTVCREYYRNLYGELHDSLNAGIPTDRFRVDWWLDSEHVQAHRDKSYCSATLDTFLQGEGQMLNSAQISGEIPAPLALDHVEILADRPDIVGMAVPRNYQGVKKADKGLAVEWRLHSRTLFEAAFAAGYYTIDFIPDDLLCTYVFKNEELT